MNTKKIVYTFITFAALGCGAKQSKMEVSVKEDTKANAKSAPAGIEAQINEEESLVNATGFFDKFHFETAGKTWLNVHNAYQEDMAKYANASPASLSGLREHYLLVLIGQPTSALKLLHDGTTATKDAIKFYLQQLEQFNEHQPQICLHFLQQAQQFMTPAQTKTWADKMVAWTNADYSFWTTKNSELDAQSNMTDAEQSGYDARKAWVEAIKQIRLIAQN